MAKTINQKRDNNGRFIKASSQPRKSKNLHTIKRRESRTSPLKFHTVISEPIQDNRINNSVALSERMDIQEHYNMDMFKRITNHLGQQNEINHEQLYLVKVAFIVALCSLSVSLITFILLLIK